MTKQGADVRRVRRLGPNSAGEELTPGAVADCSLGLLVDQPLAATLPAPGSLLVVGPAALLHRREFAQAREHAALAATAERLARGQADRATDRQRKARHAQPALLEDPQTGQWRGATDEEYAAWMAGEP